MNVSLSLNLIYNILDMEDNKQDIDTPESSQTQDEEHDVPVTPYVYDFLKYTGGFIIIIAVALIIINKVSPV